MRSTEEGEQVHTLLNAWHHCLFISIIKLFYAIVLQHSNSVDVELAAAQRRLVDFTQQLQTLQQREQRILQVRVKESSF